MAVDDPLLPAAPHLTGPRARPLLAAAVRASGGRLGRLQPRQVLYRPGRELVVRYDATVEWGDCGPVEETLLAGTTPDGSPPGTLPLEADDPAVGLPLSVGVWRYPFDPFLPGLDSAVRSSGIEALLGTRSAVELDVRTYRPTRRAVVHARWEDGEAFVKVLPPAEARALAEVHTRLSAAGVPVAPVIAADPESGLLALRALGPVVLRSRLLEGRGPWPSAPDIIDVLHRLSSVDLPVPAHHRRAPLAAAHGHARMLAAVMPSQAQRIEEICGRIGPATESDGTTTVHGDLHDGQLVTDDAARVTGLLDVDGAGPGDAIDDIANLIGHLSSLTFSAGAAARTVRAYAHDLHRAFTRDLDLVELDHRIAAVVLGLATGPFRVQQRGWRREIPRRLALAEWWLPTRERTLSGAS
jgi:Phosphotransferase enzyme family